jgi:hypothetical protein
MPGCEARWPKLEDFRLEASPEKSINFIECTLDSVPNGPILDILGERL